MTNPNMSIELIPRKVLLGNPVKTSPQISPDGSRMAYLAPVDDVLNIWGAINSSHALDIPQIDRNG